MSPLDCRTSEFAASHHHITNTTARPLPGNAPLSRFEMLIPANGEPGFLPTAQLHWMARMPVTVDFPLTFASFDSAVNHTTGSSTSSFRRESNADPTNQEGGDRNDSLCSNSAACRSTPIRSRITWSRSRHLLSLSILRAGKVSRPPSQRDLTGQCERPSRLSACTLPVSSHPLRRFRQHRAASSTTHPSVSPIDTGAQN
jgi:hypothetical protein